MADAFTASRAICADDGACIVLTLYRSEPPSLAAVELAPLQALRLAHDLAESALRHIARGAEA